MSYYKRDGSPLPDEYIVVPASVDNVTVQKSNNKWVTITASVPEGYTAIGCLPFSTENATSGGRASSVTFIFKHTLEADGTIWVNLRNTDTQGDSKVNVLAKVLCKKNS